MTKLRVLPVSGANECPFYVEGTDGAHHCFIKHTTSVHVAMAMVENNPAFNPEEWDDDCGGKYGKCSILPLLWNLDEEGDESTLATHSVDEHLDEYDPFEGDEEPASEPEPVEKYDEPQVEESPSENEDEETEEEYESDVRVSLHLVKDPYYVKADVLVYPTNIVLTIDDELLNRVSRGLIQLECDRVPRPIKMGHVYVTSNGGEMSKVKAKAVFQAVVAGPSRLVNEQDIRSAVRKSLRLAEEMGAKTVVMMPCDCGTHDINDAARVQLSAIKTFLRTHKTESLTNIFIVMEDDDSLEVFEEYFERIFE